MKRIWKTRAGLIGAALAGVVLLAGCKSQNNTTAAAMADTAAAAAPAPAPAAAPAAPTDPQIAKIAMSANSGDSARGKLAEQKGTNRDVKAFGRVMVADHGALNRAAEKLAAKLSLTPEASSAESDLVSKVQGMTTELQSKSGADFDKTYMDQEVGIHQLVLDDLDKTLIPSAQNAELKALLTDARAKVEAHLKQAQAVQARLK